jgi:NIPSNAP
MTTHESTAFELRTYTCYDGKLPELLARFRDHAIKLLEKHGMTNVAYWVPQDAPLSQNTLIYVLSHASREAAKKNWDAFRNDPEWQRVREETEARGKLVLKIESVFMNAAEFSPLK